MQRLKPFEKLAGHVAQAPGWHRQLLTQGSLGGGKAVNGNIRMPINRGWGYTNLRYLLLKAKRAQWPEAHLKLVEDKANRTGCDPVITA